MAVAERLGRIEEHLKDQDKWLEKINEQTRKTNGALAKSIQKISIIEQKQKDHFYIHEKKDKMNHDMTDWSIRKASIVISVVLTITLIVVQFAIAYMR